MLTAGESSLFSYSEKISGARKKRDCVETSPELNGKEIYPIILASTK